MASSPGPQKTSTSPFNIFRGASWTNGRKKVKAKLGEENNMYFHPELKRWVERGKEEEAEREAAGPPPPPVLSTGSLTSTPLSKRSLSQRYVLQPNLSISSSMASLAGSVSQNDLAGLSAGNGDSFSGPPSAIGSTAPSPPQSSNNLVPPAAFAASGPPSSTGLGSPSPAAFFIPSPRQPSTPPSPGSFFVPSPTNSTANGGSHELAKRTSASGGGATAPADVHVAATTSAVAPSPADGDASPAAQERSVNGYSKGRSARVVPHPTQEHQQDSESCLPDHDGPGPFLAPTFSGATFESNGDGPTHGFGGPHDGPCSSRLQTSDPSRTLSGAELSLRNSLNASASAARVHSSSAASAGEMSSLAEDNDTLSFPSTGERLVDSPVAFVAAVTHGSADELPLPLPSPLAQQHPPGLLAREYRRLGGAAANASDGGAAISLHEGMGVAPAAGPHRAGCEVAAAAVNSFEPTAEEMPEVEIGLEAVEDASAMPAEDGGEAAEPLVNGDGAFEAAGGEAETATAGDAAAAAPAGEAASSDAATAAASGDSINSSSAVYSQYYYQQYAYLYQYAVGQGYTEADAVAYAQYYATVYAQQYEAQAPEGQLGDGGAAAADAEGVEPAVAVVAVEAVEAIAVGTGPDAEGAAAVAVAAGVVTVATAAPEVVAATPAEPAWQVAAVAVEAEAPAVEGTAEAEAAEPSDDPVYVTSAPLAGLAPAGTCAAAQEAANAVEEAEEAGPVSIRAVPLPADLTAAATAAAQHHQSAVTAAVAAAAASVEQRQARTLLSADAPASALGTADDASVQSASASGLAPQLLLGLGAAGAKRLTQLSTAVASLGATVAAAAPVAAALSAASAAASTAAAVAGSFSGLDAGLSEDDFERIMHPGDPAKLDGPLPWELPEHLRTGRKFLALCANWQLANPGQPYAPRLLLQQLQLQQEQQQQARVVEVTQPQQQASRGDVALAAEGGSGSAGGAGSAAGCPEPLSEPAAAVADEQLSSYERACRLSQFGQPAGALLPVKVLHAAAAVPAPVVELTPTQEPPPQSPVSPDSDASAAAPNSEVSIVASAQHVKHGLDSAQAEPPSDLDTAAATDVATVADAAVPPPLPPAAATPLDLGLLPPVDSPSAHHRQQGQGSGHHTPTPSSARSDDPFAGAEHVPLSLQLAQLQQQQGSRLDSPARMPYGGITLKDVLEAEDEEKEEERGADGEAAVDAAAAAVEVAAAAEAMGMAARVQASGASYSLPPLGAAEAADFFEHLGEEEQQEEDAQASATAAEPPAATEPPAVPELPAAALTDIAAVELADVSKDLATAADAPEPAEAAESPAGEDSAAAELAGVPAAAAAAAIDSVVQALEQLRSSAGNGDGAVVDPAAGTALLLQIQSSLAQATEALAGMGVDVSALATLAVAPRLPTPATPTEWTPGASHKRQRVEASPATPTRVAASDAQLTESGVVTPLLPPGPPVVRPVAEDPAAGNGVVAAASERFHQLGRQLSDASAEAAALTATAEAAAMAQSPVLPASPVVMSLTVTPAPEVDVVALEARVRCEEAAAWEARLGATVDSEREAAALVIAGVERERDGLAARVEDLERALAAASAEGEGLVARLGEAEAECAAARAAGDGSEAARGALEARLSEVTAERDALAAALATERSEKAALAEALTAARSENEELRQRYAERFASLTAELDATRGSLAELQGEHDELLLCLGQESTKVEVLTGALREAGGDPDPLIERIEAEYETMGLGQAGEEGKEEGEQGSGEQEAPGASEEAEEGVPSAEASSEGKPEEQLPVVADEGAGEGWEGEDLLL